GIAPEHRDAYLLGRGLLYYYGCDDPKAKKAFSEKELASNVVAKSFISRIERDPVRQPVSSGGSDNTPPPVNGGNQPPKVDPGKEDPAARDLTADLAKLRAKLHVSPSSDGNGRIGLRYSFADDSQSADFENKGLDMCERNPSNDVIFGGGTGLLLSSNGCGFAMIDCPFKGDFTIDATVQVEAGPSSADLVFFCGLGKGKGTGMTWMGQIVELSASGNYVAKGGNGVDQTKWKTKATNTLKLVREGTRVSYRFNGLDLGNATFAPGDGKCGIMVNQMRVLVRNFAISGQLGTMKK
ncbi:hypothetical protein HY251_03480, partial [bacterium]|nr:hypothetical protein [bacterium]